MAKNGASKTVKTCVKGHVTADDDSICPICGVTMADGSSNRAVWWVLGLAFVLAALFFATRPSPQPNPSPQAPIAGPTGTDIPVISMTETMVSTGNTTTAIAVQTSIAQQTGTTRSTAIVQATRTAQAYETATARTERTSTARQQAIAQSTAGARSTAIAAANRTAMVVATRTVAARQTATAQSQPATGRVASNGLRVRPGPGTEYNPPTATLRQGATVSIVGWNTASDGTRWWKIASPSGWVSSDFVRTQGCVDCVARVDRPPRPTATPVPPPAAAAPPASLATNRGPLLSQEQNRWSYQYEQDRGSGNFALFSDRRSYNGIDCYISPLDGDARVCADGELHPSPKGRVVYRWDSDYDGSARLSVHAHKIDTRYGDGIRIQIQSGERGGAPRQLGEFTISRADNNGETVNYDLQLSPSTYILVMIDILGNAEGDQSRVYIDINRR